MTEVLGETRRSLRASPIFAFYVLASLAVAGVIGLITIDVIDLGFSHFGDPAHRTHDITYGFLFTTAVVGLVAQLRRPEQNVAGMLMAPIPMAALALAGVLSNDMDAVVRFHPLRWVVWVTVVAALVHPAGRAFFRSFSAPRVNRVMLALVGVAAVLLLALASTNIRLQETVLDEHAGTGHYGFMAAFGFTVIAVGVLASLRPLGWRLTAWVAGLLPALLGVTSVLYPDAVSSLDPFWAVAAIAWGFGFVAAAAITDNAEGPTPLGSPRLSNRDRDAQSMRQLSN